MSKSNSTTNGRLCNQIIRNLAMSFIAEKHDLYVEYSSYDKITGMGIPLHIGSKRFNETVVLDEQNFFDKWNETTTNLDANRNYFQTNEIAHMIYNHMHSMKIQTRIMDHNPHKHRYQTNLDVFVHVRLTDAAKDNPGADYYLRALSKIPHETLYISTDDKTHEIITKIRAKYSQSVLIEYNDVETIQFASTCKNIVLSHGSFSAMIGYIAFYSTIYYPPHDINKRWYGDIFNIDGWIEI